MTFLKEFLHKRTKEFAAWEITVFKSATGGNRPPVPPLVRHWIFDAFNKSIFAIVDFAISFGNAWKRGGSGIQLMLREIRYLE